MTREEAIAYAKRVIDLGLNDETQAFCETAIKALEQKPCADMVSRDAMWEVLQRLYGTEGELVEELMSLPPVLQMPKMGRWIKDKCSICGEERALYGLNPPYCPDCGSYNGGEK